MHVSEAVVETAENLDAWADFGWGEVDEGDTAVSAGLEGAGVVGDIAG